MNKMVTSPAQGTRTEERRSSGWKYETTESADVFRKDSTAARPQGRMEGQNTLLLWFTASLLIAFKVAFPDSSTSQRDEVQWCFLKIVSLIYYSPSLPLHAILVMMWMRLDMMMIEAIYIFMRIIQSSKQCCLLSRSFGKRGRTADGAGSGCRCAGWTCDLPNWRWPCPCPSPPPPSTHPLSTT